MPTNDLRVVLCDDHPVYLRGLRVLFAEIDGIQVVGEAADGENAIDVATTVRPDVVVMDSTCPGSTASRPPGSCSPTIPSSVSSS